MARYHLTRKDREICDPEIIDAILGGGRLAQVALCRGEEPYIVTMNYGYDPRRGALYFHCAKQGQKLDFMRENPRVCATIVRDLGYVEGRCEHKFQSLVLRGRLRTVETLEGKKHGLDILLNHQEKTPGRVRRRHLREDSVYSTLEMLRLDIEEITGKEA
ncbi:MAG: pyridoxamine 5'-phosphate oxidase family protein [Candidatus Krumholzibacteriota bacterium]|nr:pyridoxamine 5'-phosphate oxidase family protein [Candidatus Krumholzibacteriota bacterium]